MVIFLGGTAISAQKRNSIAILTFMLLHFYTIYLFTVFWLYLSEVANDNQFSVAATAFYVNGVIVAFITEYLIEFFGIDGVFFLLMFCQFLGLFFFKLCVKETSGLTDHQKKEMYYPK